jgi:hypothetical protein
VQQALENTRGNGSALQNWLVHNECGDGVDCFGLELSLGSTPQCANNGSYSGVTRFEFVFAVICHETRERIGRLAAQLHVSAVVLQNGREIARGMSVPGDAFVVVVILH